MRPEELLPTNLTLSIGSRVPPAVTSTLRALHAPSRAGAPLPADGLALVDGDWEVDRDGDSDGD